MFKGPLATYRGLTGVNLRDDAMTSFWLDS
jgi:hypothetical protein